MTVAPRLRGLDGLRGVAVAVVVLYHLDVPGVADAGFLGVDIFFTISGFIITALLLREWFASGGVRMGRFYSRRARRLLPAALAMIAVAVPLTAVLAPDALERLLSDIPAALFYASNWWQLASQQSYFESFGRPPLLQHLWSLAVEEQFYILWPPLLVALLRLGGVSFAGSAAVVLATASAGWMAWVHAHGGGVNRSYLGSDTHASGLLIGAALACAAARWRLLSRTSPLAKLRHAVQGAGALAFVALAAWVAWCHPGSQLLFQGGFLLVSVLAAVVVLAVTDGSGWLARCMEAPPLQWLGTRSYSLYLWHWPVCVWFGAAAETGEAALVNTIGKVVVTLVAGEISHGLVERGWSGRARRRAAALAPSLAALGLALIALPLTPGPAVPVVAAPLQAAASAPDVPGSEPTQLEAEVAQAPVAAAGPLRPAGTQVLVVGDSVMLGARDYITRALPGTRVDAAVGRQFPEGLQVVTNLRAQSALPPVVVLHLGTNGYIVEAHLHRMLHDLRDRTRVVLVDIHANRRWTAVNNEMIHRVGKAWPNVVIVPWDAASRDQAQYFVKDGIHLTSEGTVAVTREVARAAGLAMAEVAIPSSRLRLASAVSLRKHVEVPIPAGAQPVSAPGEGVGQQVETAPPAPDAAPSVEAAD